MEFTKNFALHICGIPSRACKIIQAISRPWQVFGRQQCFYQQLTPKTIKAAQKWKRHKSFKHCFSGVSCWLEGLRTVTLLQKTRLSKPVTNGNKHLGDLLGVGILNKKPSSHSTWIPRNMGQDCQTRAKSEIREAKDILMKPPPNIPMLREMYV